MTDETTGEPRMPQPPGTPGTPAGAPGPAPTCYRHPGRETWIRCTRCERPICPDCMVAASVGFQCPECVREGAATQREARTLFGGRVVANTGLVTKTLIGICVAAFVAQVAVPWFTGRFVLFPIGVAAGQWYRLLTAAFLHGGILHLALNMLALWIVGPGLEAALGRGRFIALYFTALLAGSVASYWFLPPLGQSLGASGAIFGLFGAAVVVMRRTRQDISPLVGIIVINLLLPLFVGGIDWHAHVGGLVAGVVVAAALVYPPPRVRTAVSVGVAAAVLGLSGVLAVVHTEQLRTEVPSLVDQERVIEQGIHGNPL